MEAQVAQKVYEALKDHADFTAVVSDRFFPLIAPEGTALPFAVYRVDEDEEKSKDGAQAFFANVVVVFPAQDYLDALQLKDTIRGILGETPQLTVLLRGGSTEYDDETGWIFGIVSFEIMNQ